MSQNKFEELRTLIGAYGVARAERAAATFTNLGNHDELVEKSEVELKAATSALDEHIAKMAEDPNLFSKAGIELIKVTLETSQEGFRRTTTYNAKGFGPSDVFMGDLTVFAQNLLTLAWSRK